MQETETNRTESQNVEESVALEQEIIAAEPTEQTEPPVAEEQPNPEQTDSAEVPTNNEVGEDKPKKKRKKLTLPKLLIIIAVALVLIGGGITAALNIENIQVFYFEMVDEYKYPRMKFESEQQMIEYLKGTWKIAKKYIGDEWEAEDNSDIYGVFVFTDYAYYEYRSRGLYFAEPSPGRDESIGTEFFKKYPTFNDYIKDITSKNTYNKMNCKKGNLGYCSGVLKSGELKWGDYIYKKASDDSQWPPKNLEEDFDRIKEKVFGVSEDTITQAMRGKSYESGIWSMKLGSILDEITRDCQVKIEPYEEVKDKLSTYANQLNSDYADCLDRTYLVTVTGCVLYNIDVPNYYSNEQDLISVLLVFDENSELIASAIPNESRDFEVSALLCLQRGY